MARDTAVDIAAWRSGVHEISDVSNDSLPELPGASKAYSQQITARIPSYGSAASSSATSSGATTAVNPAAPIDLTDSPESNKQHRLTSYGNNKITDYYDRQATVDPYRYGNVLQPSRKPPIINQSSSSSSSSLVSLSELNKPIKPVAQPPFHRELSVKERTLLQYKAEAARSGIPLGSPRDPSRYTSAAGPSNAIPISPVRAFSDNRGYVPSPQRHNEPIYIPDSPSKARFVSPEESEKQLRELVETICADMEDVDVDVEIPEGLKCKLLPHQKEGLAWLISREAGKRSGGTRKTGGILADDMGLGKTVQMIALILANKPSRERPCEDAPRPPKGTLIVAPVAVLNQWKQEIEDKTNSLVNLKIYMHHGPQRTKDPAKLAKYDIVLTSYQTLSSEMAGEISEKPKKGKKGAPVTVDSDDDTGMRNVVVKRKEAGPLLEAKFHRIILDEAHNIKNPSAKMSKACCELQGKFRWCLTGTPIQNGVQDLYALFAFLGSMVKPFNDKSEFRSRIEIPLNRGSGAVAVKRLQVLLSAMMLRRKKDILTGLPGIDIIEVKTKFSDPEEQSFYTALSDKVQLQINKFIAGGSIDSQYMAILTLVLRLRQACGHPYLVSKGRDSENVDVDAALAKQSKTNTIELPREESVDDLADMLSGVKIAGAQKCRVCITEQLIVYGDGVCDTCRTEIEKFAGAQSSTKIRKLLEILSQLRKEDPRQKTIVFSQFTEFLDIIGPALRRAGIKYVDYRGSMKIDERNKSIDDLKSNPAITVILLSFKCGSVGLNLTCCSNVVLMDLWWNPALETQGFDRANRIGQTKKVRAYKIMIENTIEDRILELQDKKRQIASSIVDGEKIKMNKLSTKDLLFLFDRN